VAVVVVMGVVAVRVFVVGVVVNVIDVMEVVFDFVVVVVGVEEIVHALVVMSMSMLSWASKESFSSSMSTLLS
jgi:hypothetical protein